MTAGSNLDSLTAPRLPKVSMAWFSEFKGTVDQRKEVAGALAGIASQRAIAKVLGVGAGTVARDLGAPSGARDYEKPAVLADRNLSLAPSGAAFQIDADPYRLAKNRERQEQKRVDRIALAQELTERNQSLPVGERTYSVIYADPPWSFEVWSESGKNLAAENHCPTMALDQIKAMPVGDLADKDCALFLWAIAPMMPQAFDVIEAWGFAYKTMGFVLVKQTQDGNLSSGTSYWTQSNAEFCLLATRGSPLRMNNDVHQIIISPRGKHSEKPDEAAARIERLVCGPYIELFARKPRPGWDVWGNQAEAAAVNA
jgi:N6-adenosine-specific RNA methylase IME4/stage V sporulation protein SpoVS